MRQLICPSPVRWLRSKVYSLQSPVFSLIPKVYSLLPPVFLIEGLMVYRLAMPIIIEKMSS
jgi:hypothetical protein